MSSSFQIIQPLYLLETKIIYSVNILLFLNPRIRIQEAKMLRFQQILSTGKNQPLTNEMIWGCQQGVSSLGRVWNLVNPWTTWLDRLHYKLILRSELCVEMIENEISISNVDHGLSKRGIKLMRKSP